MRLLLDEDCGSHSLLSALRQAGHDVERVVDSETLGGGTTDVAVFDYAVATDRALITKNGDDFVNIAQRRGDVTFPGLFVLHYALDGSNLAVASVVRAIGNIATTYDSTRSLILDVNHHLW